MSKMGQELERRLDENKYEMYRVLQWVIEDEREDNYTRLKVSTKSAIWQVLAKIGEG
jgi:hypothetical protein